MDSNTLKQQLNVAIQRRDLLQNQKTAIDVEVRQLSEVISQLNRSIPAAQAAERQNQNVQSYNNQYPGNNPNPVI